MKAESPSQVRVSACGRSDRGRRRRDNEDCFLALDLADPSSALRLEEGAVGAMGPLEFPLRPQGAILLVADGMGGRAGGAKASSMAIAAVEEMMLDGLDRDRSEADFAARLTRALEAANLAIHECGRSGPESGMGSTATLAGILGQTVYVAQVGDSRAYLVRPRSLGRLTRDQSLVQDLIDSGVLDEGDTRGMRDNTILQALGPTPSVRPVVTHHRLRRGDTLLLCSDGLSGVVHDDEIAAAVYAQAGCEDLCGRLIALANERGGPDNITVVVARFDGEGLKAAGDEGIVERREYRNDAD